MDINQKDTELELEDIESESDDLDIDTAPYKIRTFGSDFTLELYSQKIDSKEILIPDFQRKYVWPVKKASKLIESFLLGLPVPQIFLFQENEKRDLLVVDGQQRLLSVHFFLKGVFNSETPFRLKSVNSKWEGKLFSELEESDKRRLKNYVMRATIFEQIDPTDNKSVYEIFERLNTGGMPLTEQEVRNCVNTGPINQFLETINKTSSWRNLLGKQDPDKRMKDVELILRVLSLVESWEKYKKPMKDYITDFMRMNINLSQQKQQSLAKSFAYACDYIDANIGPTAFHMSSGRLNVAVLDSLLAAAILKGEGISLSSLDALKKLKQNDSYIGYVSKSTTDDDSVKGRIKMCMGIF